jgi:hypothetical protein
LFWRAIFLVLLFLAGVAPALLGTAKGQGTDTSVLYVSPTTSHSSSSFTIYVYLNLSYPEQFNAFDIQLSYNQTVLQVPNQQSLVAGPGAQEVAHCVDGVGTACNISDRPGVVHSAASFPNIFQGQVTGLLLFSLQFGIVGIGTSLFHPFNDTLANPNPAPHPFLHLTQDGIYSNRAVTAFFNTSPAIPIVNQNVSFDGSGSFTTPSGVGIAAYSWDFGDGSMTGHGSVVSHNYTASASYKVTLTVTDKSGGVGKIWKSMFVSANLGGINVNIRAVGGNQVASQVIAGLYNGSVFVENRTKPVATTGSVSFLGLKPGSYRVSFSGPGVVVSSMVETVIPGWITYDTAFLTIVDQSRSDSLGFYILLVVVTGGGIALGSVAILRRRHGRRKR